MVSKRLLLALVSLSAFFVFIILTNPQEISLAALLIPFLLAGVAIYNFLIVIIGWFSQRSIKRRKIRLFAVVGTVIFINFILLSSIGQLTVQDTVLTALITIVGGFYLYKFQIS